MCNMKNNARPIFLFFKIEKTKSAFVGIIFSEQRRGFCSKTKLLVPSSPVLNEKSHLHMADGFVTRSDQWQMQRSVSLSKMCMREVSKAIWMVSPARA